MARLLQDKEADLYWNVRPKQDVSKSVILSRIAKTCFTSKAGLCAALQERAWTTEVGVANVQFPRCYHTNVGESVQDFLDDYRITACMSLLKYFVHNTIGDRYHSSISFVGSLPLSTVRFAIDRCKEHISTLKNDDIDTEPVVLMTHEWEKFLRHHYLYVHQKKKFLEEKQFPVEYLQNDANAVLSELANLCPQYALDGMCNLWIGKPGNSCRGIGIHLLRNYHDIIPLISQLPTKHTKYVIQKYVENTLLIYGTKFDIRQWFLVTSAHPLTIWMYRECYIRFCSQKFDLFNCHESVHLTNNAIQRKYKNGERDTALPRENMWSLQQFKNYLTSIGHTDAFEKIIYPGMKQSIIGAMLASQENMDNRPNSFQLYGADFILDANQSPWLLEINSCPDMGHSTTVTEYLCPMCMEDIIKVVIDRKANPSASTGCFEKIYQQRYTPLDLYQGCIFTVVGRKITLARKVKNHELFCKAVIDVDLEYKEQAGVPGSDCVILDWVDSANPKNMLSDCGVQYVKRHDQIKRPVYMLHPSRALPHLISSVPKSGATKVETKRRPGNASSPHSSLTRNYTQTTPGDYSKKKNYFKTVYFNDSYNRPVSPNNYLDMNSADKAPTTSPCTMCSVRNAEASCQLAVEAYTEQLYGESILRSSLLANRFIPIEPEKYKRTVQATATNKDSELHLQGVRKVNSEEYTPKVWKRKLNPQIIESLYDKSVKENLPAHLIKHLLDVEYSSGQSKKRR